MTEETKTAETEEQESTDGIFVDNDQRLRWVIFENYPCDEIDGYQMLRVMDWIYHWIKDGKMPRNPKDKPNLREVSQSGDT